MEPKVSTNTVKVARKDEQTIITDANGREWKFDFYISSETAIASLVYQTIYMAFSEMECYSSDFEIEFTMKKKNND